MGAASAPRALVGANHRGICDSKHASEIVNSHRHRTEGPHPQIWWLWTLAFSLHVVSINSHRHGARGCRHPRNCCFLPLLLAADYLLLATCYRLVAFSLLHTSYSLRLTSSYDLVFPNCDLLLAAYYLPCTTHCSRTTIPDLDPACYVLLLLSATVIHCFYEDYIWLPQITELLSSLMQLLDLWLRKSVTITTSSSTTAALSLRLVHVMHVWPRVPIMQVVYRRFRRLTAAWMPSQDEGGNPSV